MCRESLADGVTVEFRAMRTDRLHDTIGTLHFRGGKKFEKSGRLRVRVFEESRLPMCAARIVEAAGDNCLQIGKGGEDDSTDSR